MHILPAMALVALIAVGVFFIATTKPWYEKKKLVETVGGKLEEW